MKTLTLAQAAPEDLLEQWQEALLERYGKEARADPMICSLLNTLFAYKWRGSARKLVEALPSDGSFLTFEDLRNVLARLGILTVPSKLAPKALTDAQCPCLLKKRLSSAPTVIMTRNRKKGFQCASKTTIGESETKARVGGGQLYHCVPEDRDEDVGVEGAKGWLRSIAGEFKRVFVWISVMAFSINLLSLIGPLAIMVIYDQVIAKESLETLDWLIVGVAGAAMFEIALKLLRARAQAYVGAKIDYRIGSRVFEQILHLPPIFTERAPVGGQVARIREFDGFREFFSSPLATVVIDLPFTLLFLLIMFLIGGPLVAVPIVLAFLYGLLAWISLPALKRRSAAASRARSGRYGFLVELVGGLRSLKQQNGLDVWRDRFRRLSADASWVNYELSRGQASVMSLSQTIMFLSGAVTLGFGVLLVLDGNMTMGALIATMMLVWRVLGPLQNLLSLAQRAELTVQSLNQLVELLGYRREQEPGSSPDVPIEFQGHLRFNRVSMRYSQDANPALLGVSCQVRPGEILGVVGESGSGKSTFAKLAIGLYNPQGGAITLDGIDLRQLRPITLRQTLAYVPQRNQVFPGSIRDNILLSDPSASDDHVKRACRMAGILHKVEALPQGLDTVFREGPQSHLPQGFLKQIALARAFLREAPIYIFDEPTSSMDEEDERFFLRSLELLRGSKTVVMVTQRPSHMRLCDRLLYLEEGQVRYLDTPENVLAALNQNQSRSPDQTALAPRQD